MGLVVRCGDKAAGLHTCATATVSLCLVFVTLETLKRTVRRKMNRKAEFSISYRTNIKTENQTPEFHDPRTLDVTILYAFATAIYFHAD